MAITANFDEDNNVRHQAGRIIVRIPSGRNIGVDTPALKPEKHCSYMWVFGPRRRTGKTWRGSPGSNN
jgi:hypothetical protein